MIAPILRAVALILLLGTPALAQMPNLNLMPELKSRTADEIERDEKADKAYRESLRKIPNAKVSSDPWGDVRGAGPNAANPVAVRPKPAPAKRAKADTPTN